jgi:hypothetical protein
VSGPGRQLPWDTILDRWAAGEGQAAIAAALNVNPSSVRVVVATARRRGDPRAVLRGVRPLSPTLPLAVAFGWAFGLADHRVAEALGATEHAVRKARRDLGLLKTGGGLPV